MKQKINYLEAFNHTRLYLQIPHSKSISHRHLFLNYLHKAGAHIRNLSNSRDTRLFQEALGTENFQIDFMDAGTPARFALAFFAIVNIPKVLTGNSSLCQRPVGDLVEALRAQGAEIRYLGNPGYFPLEIIRGIQKNEDLWILNTTESSQFVSALMLGVTALNPIPELQIVGLQHSWSYIHLSASVLKTWGYHVEISKGCIRIGSMAKNEGYEDLNAVKKDNAILIEAKPETQMDIDIEIDWGCASFVYLIALFTGKTLFIEGALPHSAQADYAAVEAFRALGVYTEFEDSGACIIPGREHDIPESFDGSNCPDLIPALVSAYAFLKIPMKFTGIEKLAGKESNRLISMAENLQKLGFAWEHKANAFLLNINNPTTITQYSIKTYHDHRIAMAFAPWAVCIDSVDIDDSKCTEKSFPGYWELLKMCNFELQEPINPS